MTWDGAARLPVETWRLVASLLPDKELLRSSGACKFLQSILDAADQWLHRLQEISSILSTSEALKLKEELQLFGRQGYVTRRTLLKGKRVALLLRDQAPLLALARWCGATVQHSTSSADFVLIGPRGGGCSGFASCRNQQKAFRVAWLRASCVAGRLLPRHRLGCASSGAPFSSFRSCIAGTQEDFPESEFGCYAPRLMEGLLMSTSRLRARESVSFTAHLLGAECTEELTKAHTHLIAGAALGAKYDFAMQNHIPVVSVAWLDQTLRVGLPMKERCFPVSRESEWR
ncbi:unnamed protein product [Effrenium voratum]|nr:unnamed protein product [Effrenium voratum]